MRPVVSLVAALLVITGLSACGPNASSTRAVHCTVVADPPERDDSIAPKKIISTARFWCDDPGSDKLTLTVRLQKQNSKGAWVDVTKKTFTGKGNQTIRLDDERYRKWSVSAGCAEGYFRTVVAGTSRSRGQTRSYEMTGARAANPCTPTIFS